MADCCGGEDGEASERGLSARGARIAGGAEGLLHKGFDLYLRDPFDADHNPQGILNFGTSENKLCFDLIQDRFTKPDMYYLEPDLLRYSDTQGIKRFREEIAKFLTIYAKAPTALDPEHIIVMNGCCAAFATLSVVLCDPGDGYLIPAPYYGGLNSKTWLYGEMQPVHVPLFSEVTDEKSQPFQLTIEKLETALQRAEEQGIRVRALILINPHNPLGDIYPAKLLKECLEFAHRYKLHVIMDEIYMLSVYDDTTFTSILSLDRILACVASELEYYIPKIMRSGKLLIDWLSFMDALDLCNMFSANSLATEFLKSQTFEAEIELWWKILNEKILISPGKAFCCYEPGWFRLVFSDSLDNISLCIQRLQQMLCKQMDELIPISSSAVENESTESDEDESTESDDEPSANYINTSVDDASDGYSHLKKIAVF
ncbi:1-aminocyclopropane-1-carboxylate synthase-like protein 1 isoform X2 [Hemicordylus capensis]|uniref:1-aminocyclopropane-1-carboxylate synthase-like protein 1 isoform X2 n=1 Tax=Hemicordylus capensis TaxID=884348 RepID=UPI0023028EAD|nr:1-aminocyclopropane-1-carboxylate synthase-like protein 1 isoform X2 [Hemicordylus capensis]